MSHPWCKRHQRTLLATAGVMAVATVAVVSLDAFPASGAASGETAMAGTRLGASMLLLRMLLALAAVVGLIWGGATLFRRSMGRGANGMTGAKFRVIGCTFLGPKKAIYAVYAVDRVLILGVTEAQITLLSEVNEPERVAAFAAAPTKVRSERSFAACLNALLKGTPAHVS